MFCICFHFSLDLAIPEGNAFKGNPQFSLKEPGFLSKEKTMKMWPLESITSMKA